MGETIKLTSKDATKLSRISEITFMKVMGLSVKSTGTGFDNRKLLCISYLQIAINDMVNGYNKYCDYHLWLLLSSIELNIIIELSILQLF